MAAATPMCRRHQACAIWRAFGARTAWSPTRGPRASQTRRTEVQGCLAVRARAPRTRLAAVPAAEFVAPRAACVRRSRASWTPACPPAVARRLSVRSRRIATTSAGRPSASRCRRAMASFANPVPAASSCRCSASARPVRRDPSVYAPERTRRALAGRFMPERQRRMGVKSERPGR